MTKTYTQCVSGDNLSLENIFGIIIIQLQLKKCGETLNVASNARRLKWIPLSISNPNFTKTDTDGVTDGWKDDWKNESWRNVSLSGRMKGRMND